MDGALAVLRVGDEDVFLFLVVLHLSKDWDSALSLLDLAGAVLDEQIADGAVLTCLYRVWWQL
jgi:hypothetical protein